MEIEPRSPTGHLRESPWLRLARELELGLIRALRLLSILLFDAVILAAGYAAITITEHLPAPGSPFFEAARSLSAGLFLLLYVVFIAFDVRRFLRQERDSDA